jgi:hypothetical protein
MASVALPKVRVKYKRFCDDGDEPSGSVTTAEYMLPAPSSSVLSLVGRSVGLLLNCYVGSSCMEQTYS